MILYVSVASAAQRPAAALVAHALLLKQLLKSVFCKLTTDQWRNYEHVRPAAAGGPWQAGRGLKGAHFKPYSGRWRLGAHFLIQQGGPKFDVTPLVLTLFSCFKKINFTPSPVIKKIRI